jgi:hypothetical protein
MFELFYSLHYYPCGYNLGCPITPIITKQLGINTIYSVAAKIFTPYMADGGYWTALFGVAGQPQFNKKYTQHRNHPHFHYPQEHLQARVTHLKI